MLEGCHIREDFTMPTWQQYVFEKVKRSDDSLQEGSNPEELRETKPEQFENILI